MAFAADLGANRAGQLGQERGIGIVHDGVHRVQPQTIEVVFPQPVKGVLDEELADRAGMRAIEVDRLSPGRMMAIGEKALGIGVQVVSSGPKWL